MRNKILLFLLIALTVMLFNISAGTETIQRIIAAFNYDIKVELNGETYKAYDDDGKELKPIFYEGRTYLPLKAIAEVIDASVDWNPESKIVTIQTNDPNFGIPYNDDEASSTGSGDSTSINTAPKVYGKIIDGKIKIYWDKISSEKFTGYKVVASLSNSQPVYPADGYAAYITDANTLYFLIDNTTTYNGGDIGTKFVSGKKYYFSVTALYSDTKIRGNTVELIMP